MNRIALGFAAAAAAVALGACTKESASSDAAGDATSAASAAEETATETANVEPLAAVDEEAPPASGEERFYGKKEFTIVSKQTGVETGDVVEHVRDWGRKRAEIKKTSINLSGQSVPTGARTVSDGASIATIDERTGAVTTTTNPLYDTIVARMAGRSAIDVGKEMMTQMGGRETGEKGSFAGHSCDYWAIEALGGKTCITAWGGTLHTLVNMGGMAFERTASEVRLGDGGPDEAFAFDTSKAVAAPDVSELLKKAREAAQPN